MNIISARDDRIGSRLIPAFQSKALFELCPELFQSFKLYWPTSSHDNFTLPSIAKIFSKNFAEECSLEELTHFTFQKKFIVNQKIYSTTLKSSKSLIHFLNRVQPIDSVLFVDSHPIFANNSDVIKFCHANWRIFFSSDVVSCLSGVDQNLHNLKLSNNCCAIHCRRGDIYEYLSKHELWPLYLGRVVTKVDLISLITSSYEKNWIIFTDDKNIEQFACNLNSIFEHTRIFQEKEVLDGIEFESLAVPYAMSKLKTVYHSQSALARSSFLFSEVEFNIALSLNLPGGALLSKLNIDETEYLLFNARAALIISKRLYVSSHALSRIHSLFESLPVNKYSCSFYLELFGNGKIHLWSNGYNANSINLKVYEAIDFCSNNSLCKLYTGYWLDWCKIRLQLIRQIYNF